MLDFKKHVQTELQMQVVASKSPLGWNLVHRIKVKPNYEKSFLGIDGDKVQKWEKDMVTYNKDMLAATKSSLQAGRSGSRGDRDSGSYSGSYAGYSGGSASILKRGKPATATNYKDHKVAKMGSGKPAETRDSAASARLRTT